MLLFAGLCSKSHPLANKRKLPNNKPPHITVLYYLLVFFFSLQKLRDEQLFPFLSFNCLEHNAVWLEYHFELPNNLDLSLRGPNDAFFILGGVPRICETAKYVQTHEI